MAETDDERRKLAAGLLRGADLWLESGTTPTPNEQQVDMDDPFARAAYRQRTTVQPPLGRQEGNLGPWMMAGMTPVGAAVGAAIRAAPRIATGLGAASAYFGHGISPAGETTPDDAAERRQLAATAKFRGSPFWPVHEHFNMPSQPAPLSPKLEGALGSTVFDPSYANRMAFLTTMRRLLPKL